MIRVLRYVPPPLDCAVLVAGLPGRAPFSDYLLQSNAENRWSPPRVNVGDPGWSLQHVG